MADIYKAYQFLNKSLGLKLTAEQLYAVEMGFKVQLAKQQGFELTSTDAQNLELFAHFRPRNGVKLETRPPKKAGATKVAARTAAKSPKK